MRYDAIIRAYDCMDQVNVSAMVQMTDVHGYPTQKERWLFATNVPGEGLEDPRQWLMEALLALVETL